ncbi:hypothetical protein XELAEV_18005373mg [Xenopus laevis]|uniref:Uncharacterized protein n=1 Tax=Xenopus laevis TaxID=8355 RepID=A0A974DZ33_XENLA|nr:hypothetical protein XELAEV_18005373mg [Xenopus laevis]
MSASFFFSSTTFSPTTRTLPRPASQLQPPTSPTNKHLSIFRRAGRVRSDRVQFAILQHMASSLPGSFLALAHSHAISLSLCFWNSSNSAEQQQFYLLLGNLL